MKPCCSLNTEIIALMLSNMIQIRDKDIHKEFRNIFCNFYSSVS